jgi:hypothetical protein
MPQVQLDEQVFKVAQRRAVDGGYPSVDAYIAHMVVHDVSDDADNVDDLFTAERLTHIDKAEADIQAGKFFTAEQSNEELAKRREEWLRTNHR